MAYLLVEIATIPAPTNMITDATSVTMPASHANSAMIDVRLDPTVSTIYPVVNDVNTVRHTSKE